MASATSGSSFSLQPMNRRPKATVRCWIGGDLEFVVSALEPGSLLRLLREYSVADPERLSSFHNFVLRVHREDPQSENPMLKELTEELMAATRSTIFWNEERPPTADGPPDIRGAADL